MLSAIVNSGGIANSGGMCSMLSAIANSGGMCSMLSVKL